MDRLKDIICISLLILSILLGLWGGIVSHNFSKYKESINDQVQKAKDEKQRIEAQYKQEYITAQTGYAGAIDILNERLRNLKTMPRTGCVPVADQSGTSGTMPRETENSTRAIDPAEIEAGIRQTTFYSKAMMDTLQCSRLIEFVKE